MNLRGFGPQLLIFLLWKRKMVEVGKTGRKEWLCTNGDSLNITYAEMQKKPYLISQPRLTRAIDQLLEKGFIEQIHQGGGYQQDKSVYALSHKWELWRPGMVCETRKKDSIKRGFRNPK